MKKKKSNDGRIYRKERLIYSSNFLLILLFQYLQHFLIAGKAGSSVLFGQISTFRSVQIQLIFGDVIESVEVIAKVIVVLGVAIAFIGPMR